MLIAYKSNHDLNIWKSCNHTDRQILFFYLGSFSRSYKLWYIVGLVEITIFTNSKPTI